MDQRKGVRARRQGYERQRALWDISSIERVRRCGRCVLGLDVPVVLNAAGRARYAGLMRCGSVWACPSCGAVIRTGRAVEIVEAVSRWIEGDNSALFLTETVRHYRGLPLRETWRVLGAANRDMWNSKRVREAVRQLNVVGRITAIEATYGVNGWHPHGHQLVPLAGAISTDQIESFESVCFDAFAHSVEVNGFVPPLRRHGIVVRRVLDASECGEYLCKLQDGGSLGFELARSDAKVGREGKTPFQLLDLFIETGDLEYRGLVREHEQASVGRSAVRWSPGLRERMGVAGSVDDSELVDKAENEPGDVVLRVQRDQWLQLLRVRGSLASLLEMIEANQAISVEHAAGMLATIGTVL